MKLMKILSLASVVTLVGITTGCTNINSSDEANMVQYKAVVNYTPIIEKKNKLVSGNAKVNVLFGFITWGDDLFTNSYADNGLFNSASLFFPIGKAKASAVYNACKKNKSDVLLASQYDITTKNYILFKVINCKVKGFPAKVTGLKK